MKISTFAVLALPSLASAFVAPRFAARQTPTATKLEAAKASPFAAAVLAGVLMNPGTAEAVEMPQPPTQAITQDFSGARYVNSETSSPSFISEGSMVISAFGAPSGGSSASFETLDFSMPSYGSEDTSTKKEAPPIFSNPFGGETTKEEPKADEPSAADKEAKKEAERAEREAKKEAERAEREAKKEAERAEKEAAEKKKIEEQEAAEAKKAAKEARRLAELEKQRILVERVRAEKEAAAKVAEEVTPAPAPVPAPAPEFKKLDIPEFKAPDVKVEIPEFKAPDFKVPSFSMPKVDLPEVPKAGAPKVDFDGIKKFDKIPSVSEVKGYDFGDVNRGEAALDKNLEPQEVRDQKAREARQQFKDADAVAREAEAKASALRRASDEKKALARDAKTEACKTRLGGKFICIRPFNSGY